MKRYFWILLALVTVSVFIVTGCSTTSAPSTTAPTTTSKPAASTPPVSTPTSSGTITLKFASDLPPNGSIVPGWTWWADEVQRRSNGRVKVDFYFAGALFNQVDTPDALKAGVADIANMSLTAHYNLEPITNVFGLPAMEFPDAKDGYLASYNAYLQLSQKYPAIKNELVDYKLLMWVTNPAFHIISKKQVTVPNDLKGMKIGGKTEQGQIIQGAGAVSVQVIPPNMYESLSKGVIDGGFITWAQVSTYKLTEVVSYFLDYLVTQETTQICMNLKTWNSLPPDIQKLMMDLVPESIAHSADSTLTISQKSIQLIKDSNKTMTTLTADQVKLWDTLVSPRQDAWVKDAQSKGVSDAATILSDLKGLRTAAIK